MFCFCGKLSEDALKAVLIKGNYIYITQSNGSTNIFANFLSD